MDGCCLPQSLLQVGEDLWAGSGAGEAAGGQGGLQGGGGVLANQQPRPRHAEHHPTHPPEVVVHHLA